jgi:hypothetical protein
MLQNACIRHITDNQGHLGRDGSVLDGLGDGHKIGTLA